MINRQKLIERLLEEHCGYGDSNCERCAFDCLIRNVVEALSQPPADQWIPCSERSPVETNWYPVTIKYKDEEPYIGTAEYYNGEDNFYVCGEAGWYHDGFPCDDCITAWMERPEPYKGVE